MSKKSKLKGKFNRYKHIKGNTRIDDWSEEKEEGDKDSSEEE